MDKLCIVIPAYNEEKNIETVVEQWYKVILEVGSESKLIVIDDGSKDETYEKLKKMAEDRPLLQLLTKKNGGHGDTLLFGYKYAIESGADFIFQTDSDGQTLPSEFDEFWNLRKNYTAVFGNRTCRQDGSLRKFVEKTLCFILKVIFKVNIPDANAPFRLINAKVVEKYLKLMPEHYNLPNVILTVCFKYYGEKIKFVPVTFKPRQGGVNSINIKKIIKIGCKALSDFKLISKRMKSA